NGFGDAAHVAFVLHAVADEVRDREYLQVVFAAKLDELRHAGHGAVLAHDLADYASRRERGDAREVYGGFGLAGADEDAAVAGAQRKDVAGPCQVLWLGFGINGRQDGDGAVGSADSGGDADAGVDGFSK